MPENVPDISENIQGGCSILYTELLWWGQLLYKQTVSKSNGNKPHKFVPDFMKYFSENKKAVT